MLRIYVQPGDWHGCAVVELHGTLDLAGASIARGLMSAVTASEPVTIADLAGLDFIDDHGVALLARADEQARQAGHRLLLAAPPGPARRGLDLAGLTGHWAAYASVTAAVGDVRQAGRVPAAGGDRVAAAPQ